MKAVFIKEHGGPEVLICDELQVPVTGPGEVLVRLEAAALNRLDLWVREGWPGIKIQYPFIFGADGAGEVAAVGEGVTGFEEGDKVVINANLGCGTCERCRAGLENQCERWGLLGETRSGTYAEYVVMPERNLLSMPEHFDPHQAAAAGLVFHTAWHSLISRGGLRPGETVLVVGASGGVNTASIQIAKLAGAVVYVVGSNSGKLALAASLGADELIDRSEDENWSKAIYKLTDKRGVDVVVDNVGTTFYHSFRAAAKGGRILTVGNTGGPKFEIDNRYIFGKHLSIIGSTMGTINDFKTVMGLIFEGKLKAVVDQTFPLAEAAAAQERLSQGEQLGKITLAIE
ncbi:MAG TPA: alcohol dehydrogenase catalytic domain-containing protein [Anaerolineales bacterium]|nr:alcohol dehydrogenase catalytic domain-containing protein [Anaerolineales bacterium]